MKAQDLGLRMPKRAVVIPEYDEIDINIIKNNMRTVAKSREDYFNIIEQI